MASISRTDGTVLHRRHFLQLASAGSLSLALPNAESFAFDNDGRLPVAGVTTIYQRNSHADVIFGKIMEGFDQKGGHGPKLKLASLYIEQIGKSDIGVDKAKKHGVQLYDSIQAAVTNGGQGIPAGVIIVGEHGKYPKTPKTNQTMYPRRRFFDAVADTLQKHGKIVPVFNDKHLSYNWKDANHMYQRTKNLKIPFMAGSSLPTTWRDPQLTLPLGVEIEEAIAVAYGGVESYGFHALELLQCMVERRKGGESGIDRIRCITGDKILEAEEQKHWSRELVKAALKVQPNIKPDKIDEQLEKKLTKSGPFFLLNYRDGFKASVYMANGISRDMSFAARIRSVDPTTKMVERRIVACNFTMEMDHPYGHFSYLVNSIEKMIHTGKPTYPVERTVLTTGVLDALMHSYVGTQEWVDTKHLAISYEPVDWPNAESPKFEPPPKS